ncbi:hypothetical protein Ciccas_009212 [Cichlidogyrus casuarinus]|uniref:Uncharacterized protein n=1 Tax=Cichlidogyrus casuarinus TaxID=1844966 RepID=A0ABD2PXX9_9PLAT
MCISCGPVEVKVPGGWGWLQQWRNIQAVMGDRESLPDVFHWISMKAFPQINHDWVYGLNQSKKCQAAPPALPKVIHVHPVPAKVLKCHLIK